MNNRSFLEWSPDPYLKSIPLRSVGGFVLAWSCFLGTSSLLGQSNSQPPSVPPTTAEIDSWIQDLGSDRFEVRQKALIRLSKERDLVLQPLKNALASTEDREKLLAVKTLVLRIEHQLLNERMEKFVLDTDVEANHGIEIWDKYRERIGSNRLAKQILVEAYRKHPELLDKVARGEDVRELGRATAENIRKKLFDGQQVEIGDGLAMIIAAGICEQPLGAECDAVSYRLVLQTPLAGKLRDANWQKTSRSLLGPWLLHLGPELRTEGMMICYRMGVEECRDIAREMLKNRAEIRPDEYFEACRSLATFGEEADIKLLESWLDDERVYRPYTWFAETAGFGENSGNAGNGTPFGNEHSKPVLSNCLYRDLALAASVEIAKLDLHDFNPRVRKRGNVEDVQLATMDRWVRYSRQSPPGFPMDAQEERDAAFRKWKEVRAASQK